jgi:hypothetical protein
MGMIATLCAYMRGHDHAYVHLYTWACSNLFANKRLQKSAYCEKMRWNDHAYVCVYVRASSHLCVHVRLDMTTPSVHIYAWARLRK